MDNETDTSPFENFTSLLRIAGHQVPARAIFLGQSLFSGLYTGTTLGLVCGQFGMYFTPLGPLIPFLLGTGIGFCMGLYGTWQTSVGLVRVYARNYPTILAHSLWTEHYLVVPSHVQADGSAMEDWAVHQGGSLRLTLCVLAARACERDVREIHRQQRQRLTEAKSTDDDFTKYRNDNVNIV
jgi:hypothetical protein